MTNFKKMIFALCAVLIVAGSVQANVPQEVAAGLFQCNFGIQHTENLSRQEFETIFKTCYLVVFLAAINDSSINNELQRITMLQNLDTRLSLLEDIKRREQNRCRIQRNARCALINEFIGSYNQIIANINSEWNNYRNIWLEHQRRIEEQQRQQDIWAEQALQQQRRIEEQQRQQDSIRVFRAEEQRIEDSIRAFWAEQQRIQWEAEREARIEQHRIQREEYLKKQAIKKRRTIIWSIIGGVAFITILIIGETLSYHN